MNTHGKPGCNVPCDLHMEHMNRACKDILSRMGPNMTEKTITRTGRCIGSITKVTQTFDRETNVTPLLSSHYAASTDKDLTTIVEELTKMKTFKYHKGRSHRSFSAISNKVYMKSNTDELITWMQSHVQL